MIATTFRKSHPTDKDLEHRNVAVGATASRAYALIASQCGDTSAHHRNIKSTRSIILDTASTDRLEQSAITSLANAQLLSQHPRLFPYASYRSLYAMVLVNALISQSQLIILAPPTEPSTTWNGLGNLNMNDAKARRYLQYAQIHAELTYALEYVDKSDARAGYPTLMYRALLIRQMDRRWRKKIKAIYQRTLISLRGLYSPLLKREYRVRRLILQHIRMDHKHFSMSRYQAMASLAARVEAGLRRRSRTG